MSVDQLLNLKAYGVTVLEEHISSQAPEALQLIATWNTNFLLIELILETRSR